MSEFYASASLRAEVIDRAHGCCEYCLSQMTFSAGPFVLEHIVPFSRAGRTVSENLALACPGCNTRKGVQVMASDPLTGIEVPLFHPRKQRWIEHFAWSEDHLRIIGRTDIGRATIETLWMNRDNLQNLRWAIKSVGCHPPASPPESST